MHRKDDPRTLSACSSDRQKQTSKDGQVRQGWGAGPAAGPVGTRIPASPRGGEGAEGSRLPAAPQLGAGFPLRGLGAWEGPRGQGHSQGWGVHGPAVGHTFPSLLCFSRPQTSNCTGRPPSLEHNRPSTAEKQLPGGPGHTGGTVQAGDQSCPPTANSKRLERGRPRALTPFSLHPQSLGQGDCCKPGYFT